MKLTRPRTIIAAITALAAVAAVGFTARLAAPQTKVAVVDLAKVIEGLDQQQALNGEFQTWINQQNAQLAQFDTDIQSKVDELNLLPEEDSQRREILYEIRLLEATGNARKQFVQQEIEVRRGKIWKDLYIKMRDAVNTIATQEGWDVVLQTDHTLTLEMAGFPPNPPGSAIEQFILDRDVLFASDRADITNTVITYMNNEFNNAP